MFCSMDVFTQQSHNCKNKWTVKTVRQRASMRLLCFQLLDHDAMDYEKVNYFAFGSKFDNFWYKW